jgi:DNA-binding transcriptional ArsR family regulator
LKNISTYELRNNLELSHQTLTAILSVLQDEGLIKVVGEWSLNNSVFSLWQYVYSNYERAELKEARMYEKYEAWIKRGREDFSELMPTDLFISINKVEKNLIEWKINK